jgi:hypothetical protein
MCIEIQAQMVGDRRFTSIPLVISHDADWGGTSPTIGTKACCPMSKWSEVVSQRRCKRDAR